MRGLLCINSLNHKPTTVTTMKQLDYILANETEALNFLKSKYPMYHLSNIFFRDIQYGILTMLERKHMSVGYADAEKIARAFVVQLEKKKILNPMDRQSWVLNFPDFKKPAVKPAAAPVKPAAKPAAPAAAAPGATKPSLPPLSRPAAGATPAAKPSGLPPLKSASSAPKPAGLPPLRSATPVAAKSAPASQPPAPQAQAEAAKPEVKTESASAAPATAAEAPKQAAPTPAAHPLPPGGRKPLPPLRSSGQKK